MERSDKLSTTETTATKDEAAEIDRIMKEIEELEKKMDSPELPKEIANEPDPTPLAVAQETKTEPEPALGGNVVSLRPTTTTATESMAETDAVPVQDAPLVNNASTAAGAPGSLSLKIGGCTEVALEFVHANTTVYVSYNDDGLKITTDQGAEFRIPFKRAA